MIDSCEKYDTCLWYQILKNGVSQNDCKKLLHEQQLFFSSFSKIYGLEWILSVFRSENNSSVEDLFFAQGY